MKTVCFLDKTFELMLFLKSYTHKDPGDFINLYFSPVYTVLSYRIMHLCGEKGILLEALVCQLLDSDFA